MSLGGTWDEPEVVRRVLAAVREGEGGDPPGLRGSCSLVRGTPPHSAAYPPSQGWLLGGCSSLVRQRAAVSPHRAFVARFPRATAAAHQPSTAPESALAAAGKGCGPALRTRRRGPAPAPCQLLEQVLYLWEREPLYCGPEYSRY